MGRPLVIEERICPTCGTAFEVGGRDRPPRGQRYCSVRCQPGSHAPRPRRNHDTLHNEAWLRSRYLDDRSSAADIARQLGCASQTVEHALRKFGIPRRQGSDAARGRPHNLVWTPEMREALAAKRRGPANPNWKGGITPYNRTRETYRLHRRAGQSCEVCGKPALIHHENENPLDNRPENIRYLCRPCHISHHKKRRTPVE